MTKINTYLYLPGNMNLIKTVFKKMQSLKKLIEVSKESSSRPNFFYLINTYLSTDQSAATYTCMHKKAIPGKIITSQDILLVLSSSREYELVRLRVWGSALGSIPESGFNSRSSWPFSYFCSSMWVWGLGNCRVMGLRACSKASPYL